MHDLDRQCITIRYDSERISLKRRIGEDVDDSEGKAILHEAPYPAMAAGDARSFGDDDFAEMLARFVVFVRLRRFREREVAIDVQTLAMHRPVYNGRRSGGRRRSAYRAAVSSR